MSWVFKHSPYSGERLIVHLAIADVVNDVHEQQIWMLRNELATKARCSVPTITRTLADMTERGLLEVISIGRGRGVPSVYRFLMPEKTNQGDAFSEGRKTNLRRSKNESPKTRKGISGRSSLLSNSNKTQETQLLPFDNGTVSPKRCDNPLSRKAHDLTQLAFEQPVKPALRSNGKTPFVAVLGIIESVLRAGVAVSDVERAIASGVEVWTLAGLQTAIAKSKPVRRDPARGRHETSLRETIGSALASERRKSHDPLPKEAAP